MTDEQFNQIETIPLYQPVAVKGLHLWPELYIFIISELKRCASKQSYLTMFSELPNDINPFNTSTFDIIRDQIKHTDTQLDISSGEIVLNTNKFNFKEDTKVRKTLYKLQWDQKSFNTLINTVLPKFKELVEIYKLEYEHLKELLQDIPLFPEVLTTRSINDEKIAIANKKRVRGLCNILDQIQWLYTNVYTRFANEVLIQLAKEDIKNL